ncbi:MAG: hypothetical protein N2317_01045 [Syntrophales bacterium]|nr:hypothetical protein [Syntrophales bacterium]
MERIGVKIGGDVCCVYTSLGGTFLSLVDSCTRRGVLPGFVEETLITEATQKGNVLVLGIVETKEHKDSLSEMLDIAMHNLGAYPAVGNEYDFLVEVL